MESKEQIPQWRDERFAGLRVMMVGVDAADADFLRALLNTLGAARVNFQTNLEDAVAAQEPLKCRLLFLERGAAEAGAAELRSLHEHGVRLILLRAGAEHPLVRNGKVDACLQAPFHVGALREMLEDEMGARSAA